MGESEKNSICIFRFQTSISSFSLMHKHNKHHVTISTHHGYKALTLLVEGHVTFQLIMVIRRLHC